MAALAVSDVVVLIMGLVDRLMGMLWEIDSDPVSDSVKESVTVIANNSFNSFVSSVGPTIECVMPTVSESTRERE